MSWIPHFDAGTGALPHRGGPLGYSEVDSIAATDHAVWLINHVVTRIAY